MNAKSRYLVVVCLGGNYPDLDTLKAFVASNTQGINYNPGIYNIYIYICIYIYIYINNIIYKKGVYIYIYI